MPRKLAGAVAALWILLVAIPAFAATQTVEAQDNKFIPQKITASVGDTIEFRNTGQLPHNATAKDKSFDTGNINAGETKSITLRTSGTIEYVCTYHEGLGMVGTIEVSAGGGAPATGSTSPTPIPDSTDTQAPPVGPAVPGETTSPSPSPNAAGAAAPPPLPKPPSQKYFPPLALGLFVLMLLGMGGGYLRTAMKTAGRR